jgi:hypothetical protein
VPSQCMAKGNQLYTPAALTLPPTGHFGTHVGAPEPFLTEPFCRGYGTMCLVAATCFGITLPSSGSVPSAILGVLVYVCLPV